MDVMSHEAEEVFGTAETAFDATSEETQGTADETTQTTTEGAEETAQTPEEKTETTLTIPEGGEGEGEENTEGEDEGKANADGEIADFDISEIESEFYSNNGELSKETLQSLYKQFPKNLVDNYMANAKAAFDAAVLNTRNEVFGIVGGEAKYGELMKWAGKNLSKDEIAAFNGVMAGSDLNAMKLAVKGLAAQASVTTVKEPQLIIGGKASTGLDGEIFESQAQYVEAIQDPRYEKDAAYRHTVREKLARTKRAGGYRK